MALSATQLEELCNAIIPAAYEGGNVIQEQVKKGIKILRKMDGSPVTAADQLAEDKILKMLEKLTPKFPIIGEELLADGKAPKISPDETFWLVDALDGTKEFIKGTGEYTVNIGLIENGKPVLGAVYVPEKNHMYYGHSGKAFKIENNNEAKQISVRSLPNEGITVAASRSHGSPEKIEAHLDGIKVKDFITSGSSIKFCLIAEGKADLYPRFGPTCEWDTAAAHAILNAAGGHVVKADNREELTYGKVQDKFYNPEFIALTPEIN